MTTERSEGAGAALAGVGIGAVGTWLLSKKVSAAPPGIDPQLWEALLALISSIDAETRAISELIAKLAEQQERIIITTPNADRILSSRIDLIIAGAAGVIQLPDIPVPDDMALVVKSWPFNPPLGLVYVTDTAAGNPFSSWPLVPNESIAYRVKNANTSWVWATIVPAIVFCTTELRR